MARENPASANSGISGRVPFRDRKVRPGLKEHREPPEQRVQPVSRDHRDQPGLKDCKGLKEQWGHQAPKDHRDRPALKDNQQPWPYKTRLL